MLFLRYEAATPNARGRHAGVFGLVNGLAQRGELSSADQVWLRANHRWMEEAYPDPATADPTLFDRAINPSAICWFKLTAAADPVLARVGDYLLLLDRYGIAWRVRRADDVGRLLYEDHVKVVSEGRPSAVDAVGRPFSAGPE